MAWGKAALHGLDVLAGQIDRGYCLQRRCHSKAIIKELVIDKDKTELKLTDIQ